MVVIRQLWSVIRSWFLGKQERPIDIYTALDFERRFGVNPLEVEWDTAQVAALHHFESLLEDLIGILKDSSDLRQYLPESELGVFRFSNRFAVRQLLWNWFESVKVARAAGFTVPDLHAALQPQ